MGTSGAEHRWTDGKGRHRKGRGFRLIAFQAVQVFYVRIAQPGLQRSPDGLHAVLASGLYISGELSLYVHGQVMSAAQDQKLRLQHRVQLLNGQNLLQAVHELKQKGLGHGVGGGHLEHADAFVAL